MKLNRNLLYIGLISALSFMSIEGEAMETKEKKEKKSWFVSPKKLTLKERLQAIDSSAKNGKLKEEALDLWQRAEREFSEEDVKTWKDHLERQKNGKEILESLCKTLKGFGFPNHKVFNNRETLCSKYFM